MKHFYVLIAGCIAATPAFAVFKCKDTSGKTVYQQHACPSNSAEGEKINTAPAITTGAESNGDGQARLEAIKDYNRKFDAMANRQVMRGMNKDQVITAWGRPHDINRSIGSYGVHEQWVYRGGHSAQYVYFENGAVTSIQE